MSHKQSLRALLLIVLLVNLMAISATSSFETTSSNLVLTLQTERTYYLRGEVVRMFGTVTNTGGSPIQGATIAIEVKNPSNSTIFLDIVYSSSNGSYSDGFRLSSIASVGRYTVYATASKTGYTSVTQSTIFYVTTDDLFIVSIEPIQVIPDAEALIMNKKTAVRVTVANGFLDRKWVDIRVVYDFASKTYDENGPDGFGVPLDPGLNRIYVPGGPTFPVQTQPWIPANQPPWFEWNAIGYDGSIRAIVDPFNDIIETNEDNNEATTQRKIVESNWLKILCVPVYFPLLLQGPFSPSFNYETRFLLDTYPVAENRFVWTQSPSIPWPGIPLGQEWLYWNVALPITLMAKVLRYDRAVIAIQDPSAWGIAIGMLRNPENRVPVIITNRAPDQLQGVLAHEIGHTYYLWHPHDLGPEVYDAYRFWVTKRDYEKGPAPVMNTLMSYRMRLGLPIWIDKGRFDSDPKTLLTRGWYDFPGDPLDLGLPPSRGYLPSSTWRWNLMGQFKTSIDPEVIIIRGTLFENGTVTAPESWYRLPEGMPDLLPGTTGNYSIVLMDRQSQVLSQLGFNASFTYLLDINGTLTEARTDTVPFIFSIPYVDGTYKIEIQNATGYVLISKTVSSNLPTATVTFPNGGEILAVGTNYAITWEASDLDGDPLTYSIAYSVDAGENWIPLAMDLQGNSYVWNTSQLASGNNYLVKVIANDGINTGEDISDGTIKVTIQGDITGDFVVNVYDLFALGKAYGTTPSPNWNRNADINNDLIVNVFDLEILQENYGKTAT